MRKSVSAGRGLLSVGSVALTAYLLLHLTFHLQKSYRVLRSEAGQRWKPEPARNTLSTDEPQRLIPRIIHQTYKTRHVSKEHWKAIQSWRLTNPRWEYRFYDDLACEEFVANEFPQWLDAYHSLPLAVEQADFFRYLVVLRYGGVYADVDTECGRPLDEFIMPFDSLVVGWEDEYPTPELAVQFNFARQRQLEQWVFAAEPGHPALQAVCERVAANAYLPYNRTNTDALFRTGPGPFTDEVLKYALEHEQQGKHGVRILPRVTLGGLPGGQNGMKTWDEPARLVAHLHMGSWKSHSFKRRARLLMDEGSVAAMLHAPSKAELLHKLYPASCGMASQITTWGHPLAPGAFIMQRPLYQELMAAWQDQQSAGQVLLDVGAGMGFYTAAAAAAGHRVEAIEAEHSSLVSLQASVAYNGFSKTVNTWQVPAGLQKALSFETIAKNGTGKCGSPPVLSGKSALQLLNDQLPKLGNVSFGAARLSVAGSESQAVHSLKGKLAEPSLRVLLLEAYPQYLPCSGTNDTLEQTLAELKQLGFSNIVHMGNVCMRIKTQGLLARSFLSGIVIKMSSRARRGLEQKLAADNSFRWCAYNKREFHPASAILAKSHEPEVFLLSKSVYGKYGFFSSMQKVVQLT